MDTPKKGLGWKEAQRQGDFVSNFSIYTYMPQNIYTGSVRVFDKYLQCWYWTIHNFQLIHLHNMENYLCVRIVYFIPFHTYHTNLLFHLETHVHACQPL